MPRCLTVKDQGLSPDIAPAAPSQLYLFSDGVFETRRQYETASLDGLIEFLVRPGGEHGPTIADIRERTLEYLDGAPPPDDCSVLKVSLS
jgi:hypothetical protein